MTDKKQLAQHLYMAQGKTQKEIAIEVGVSERTIYTWIHQFAWDKLKVAAYQAPAIICENLCASLIELQNAIAARESGKRYPTPQEAEVIRKLINSIEKMKKYPSLSQNMQILETFKNYMRPIDKEFTGKLANYTERFLEGKSVNGFAPYQLEYGVQQVAPIMPFYDELPTEAETCPKYGKNCSCTTINACPNPNVSTPPCDDMDDCLHEGACTWPDCRHPKQYYSRLSTRNTTPAENNPTPATTEEERRQNYRKYMKANGFDLTQHIPPTHQAPEKTGSDPAILNENDIQPLNT